MPPYTHFRFIAYEVPTAARETSTGQVKSGFDPGEECDEITRIPVNWDPTLPADGGIRLKRLAAVVDLAETTVRGGRVGSGSVPEENILNIFMAPEFYFRPSRLADLDYEFDTYSEDHAVAIFEQLNTMFMAADFKHWFLVLGTVLWNWEDDHQVPGHPDSLLYRNSAAYVRGHREDSLRIIEKNAPSGIDGMPNPYDLQNRQSMQEQYQTRLFRKQRVFDIDGIPCGLEICLDHLAEEGCRTLKNVLLDWHPKPVPHLRLHLLTAGGMAINPTSVTAIPSGYILRNDGLSGNNPPSEMRKISGYRKLTGGTFVNTYPPGPDNTAIFQLIPVREKEVPLDGKLIMKIPDDLSKFPQKLVFYKPFPFVRP